MNASTRTSASRRTKAADNLRRFTSLPEVDAALGGDERVRARAVVDPGDHVQRERAGRDRVLAVLARVRDRRVVGADRDGDARLEELRERVLDAALDGARLVVRRLAALDEDLVAREPAHERL